MINKEEILSQARAHLVRVCKYIEKGLKATASSLIISKERFSSLSYEDQIVEREIMSYGKKKMEEMSYLNSSPYFVRCDVLFAGDSHESRLYFAKFGFDQEAIYSWITPASVMRFEEPGEVRYRRPDGTWQMARLLRKDQYLIAGQKIKFLSTQSQNTPRALIYEEYFSTQKAGFMLPEIVAQMEKAQDQVIRAHHIGPFLISGPAGSGKTTLALHRVAYLAQVPDLAGIFTHESIIVFVQDNGTKAYFSRLLPELGINDVVITTFSEWAFALLDIQGGFVERFGQTEQAKDLYEYRKLQALKRGEKLKYSKRGTFSLLEKIYAEDFNEEQKKIFQQQRKMNLYDRIDVTVLLRMFYQGASALGAVRDYSVEQKNGKMKKKRGFVPWEYSLVVVDEFQNYLPEQLRLIKSCVSRKSQAVVYVGDMAQQVKLGTIRRWEEIDEKMEQDRKVILEKVYRNTKNILKFIQQLGYNIEVFEKLKEGVAVGEYILDSKEQEMAEIKKILAENYFGSVGILAKEAEYLTEFRQCFAADKKIHLMTMNEAQGVEFEIVVLVGIGKDTFVSCAENMALAAEKKRINKDLLYVALTRAISQLHIMGSEKLRNIIAI